MANLSAEWGRRKRPCLIGHQPLAASEAPELVPKGGVHDGLVRHVIVSKARKCPQRETQRDLDKTMNTRDHKTFIRVLTKPPMMNVVIHKALMESVSIWMTEYVPYKMCSSIVTTQSATSKSHSMRNTWRAWSSFWPWTVRSKVMRRRVAACTGRSNISGGGITIMFAILDNGRQCKKKRETGSYVAKYKTSHQ